MTNIKGVIQLDYTWVYDDHTRSNVVVVLTEDSLDPDEIIEYAYQVNAIRPRTRDKRRSSDRIMIKFPGDTDPQEFVAGWIRNRWR